MESTISSGKDTGEKMQSIIQKASIEALGVIIVSWIWLT